MFQISPARIFSALSPFLSLSLMRHRVFLLFISATMPSLLLVGIVGPSVHQQYLPQPYLSLLTLISLMSSSSSSVHPGYLAEEWGDPWVPNRLSACLNSFLIASQNFQ